MAMITNKELAAEMGCSTDTFAARRKLLKIKPTFGGLSGHRWSREDADKFISAWSSYSQRETIFRPKSRKKPTPKRK